MIVRGGLVFLLAIALWAVALMAWPLPRASAPAVQPGWIGPLAIVDAAGASVLPGQALRIAGGRIAEVRPFERLSAEQRAAATPAGGAFAVAGLWDMHAVLTRYAASLELPLQLAHGITRLRAIVSCPREEDVSLYACERHLRRWNAQSAAGELAGPRIMGFGSYPLDRIEASEASALVATRHPDPGLPRHIKTYDGLSRAGFFALLDAARAAGIEVSGHVPAAVRASEAAQAGLKAIAHARVLPIACSSEEDRIGAMRTQGRPAADWMRVALDSQDPARCAAFFTALRARGTFVSPTLVTRYNETRAGLRRLRDDPLTRVATPAVLRLVWQEDAAVVDARPEADDRVFADYYRLAAALVAQAARAGVSLLLGSDTNDAYVAPGAGLHHEIRLWHEAGIPAASILAAATLAPARYYGLERSHGRIAPGHVADLVLVRDNPLENPLTLQQPLAVMIEGRLHSRDALDGLAASAHRAAASWRYPAHLARDFARNPRGFAN